MVKQPSWSGNKTSSVSLAEDRTRYELPPSRKYKPSVKAQPAKSETKSPEVVDSFFGLRV
jgi:hypothetical protein